MAKPDQVVGCFASSGSAIMMVMLPSGEIAPALIDDLVANGVTETETLEFKQIAVGNSGEHRREFATDVAALANSLGGDIVFGVGEKNGIAVSADGISCADSDKEVRRLRSILETSIDPRVPGLRVFSVQDASRTFVVVRVPRSTWGLHMVTADGLQRFVARAGTQRFPLNVHQIRAGFLASAELADRASSFHDDRVKFISGDESSTRGAPPTFCAVHFIPLARLDANAPVDLRAAETSGLVQPFFPSGGNSRYNLDGLVIDGDRTYAVLFRNGAVELASERILDRQFSPVTFARSLVGALKRYSQLCSLLQIPAPIGILATIFNVRHIEVAIPAEVGGGYYDRHFDRANIRLPNVVLPSLEDDYAASLRPMVDALWQSIGSECCPYFGSDGRLVLP